MRYRADHEKIFKCYVHRTHAQTNMRINAGQCITKAISVYILGIHVTILYLLPTLQHILVNSLQLTKLVKRHSKDMFSR